MRNPWDILKQHTQRVEDKRRETFEREAAEQTRAAEIELLTIAQDPELGSGVEVTARRLAAGVVIPAGCIGMLVRGVAQPFTAEGFRAGAKLLGYAVSTYDNTGCDELRGEFRFRRHRQAALSEAPPGDAPTEEDIGGEVALVSMNTLRRTVRPGDLRLVLLDVPGPHSAAGLPYYEVLLP